MSFKNHFSIKVIISLIGKYCPLLEGVYKFKTIQGWGYHCIVKNSLLLKEIHRGPKGSELTWKMCTSR